MAKFYVQSGTLRGIVDCFDSECAGVWAVNRVMGRITSLPSMSTSSIENEDEGDELSGMFALDDSIRISEQGFDRDDCEIMDTHLAFVHWHQLKKAIDAMHQQWDEM
jgi:hypothetical protein